MSRRKAVASKPSGSHKINPDLLQHPVYVTLVGCGGNGSQMLSGLARLHLAMKSCGHPGGLRVDVYDPDRVSPANVGRGLFSMADVGAPKACVLVHRINTYFGLCWNASPTRFTSVMDGREPVIPQDILITCVDTAKARREIHAAITDKGGRTPKYWLDLGNRQNDGQTILGEPNRGMIYHDSGARLRESPHTNRLPTVADLFPELLDESFQEDDVPSCSLAEALERQDLFVNDHVSRWALHLLWTLFRRGAIEHHGYFVNLESGVVNPLPVPADAAKTKGEEN